MAENKSDLLPLSSLALPPETHQVESREEAMARKINRQEGKIEGLREYITWLEEKNAQLQKQNEALLLLTEGQVN